ncbi:MAG TPA: hypothetical protein VKP67_28465 [Xanthobacteraceae bacterium]|nr:hypothetical protein [Xanthobacteraceae bacterium]
MTSCKKLFAHFCATAAPALLGAASLVSSSAAAAPCQGPPGTPAPTQTKCLTAVQIPGHPLRSFDISWVNPDRAEYYLADRSNSGIDIINTNNLKFQRTIGGFVGIKLRANGTVNNDISGPDGVTSHGRWLYAGDGDSTLKVIDLNAAVTPIKQIISTGGTTRVDEMALTTDGRLLLAANNAEDPPFATLFSANGDDPVSHVAKIIKITVDPAIMPPGGSIEQPAWDPKTKRFYTSIPTIANNPPGCTLSPVNTCSGGLLVTDPAHPKAVEGAFNPATNTGVVPLTACGPNGATVGPHDNLLLGCTPNNLPGSTTTLVINARTKNTAVVTGITGSDEVWFNKGDDRYYLGASAFRTKGVLTPVLGVVDGTSVLIETIPVSSGSHSVAADSKRNLIFSPQVAPAAVVGAGGDTTTNGAAICGSNNGCVAVFKHDEDDEDEDEGHDH